VSSITGGATLNPFALGSLPMVVVAVVVVVMATFAAPNLVAFAGVAVLFASQSR